MTSPAMIPFSLLKRIHFKAPRQQDTDNEGAEDGRTRRTTTTSPGAHRRRTGRDRLFSPRPRGGAPHPPRASPPRRAAAPPPVLHGPYLTWTRTAGGKTVTRKISQDQQARYQAWFDNARKLRQLLTDLETLSLQAFDEAEGTSKR